MTIRSKISIIIFVFLFVSAYLFLFFLPKPQLLAHVSFSRAVFSQQQQLLRLTLSQDEKYRLFTPLGQMSSQFIAATLMQEDKYFYWHFGVNPIALIKAAWQTYVVKSRRMGASTITMQLARITLGMNSKKISGKLWQILRAMQIEMHYSKKEILEAYLNLAPYGGNIEGVGAASLIYFNTPADKMTLPQALTLSIIPQNPGKRTPGAVGLKESRDRLFHYWLTKYPEDKNKEVLFHLPLVMQTLRQVPFKSPHFVTMVLNDPITEQHHLITTLDLGLQMTIERIARHYLARKRNQGVYNTAILLVDTRDRGVKGLLGSADFFNQEISGQINGVETKRSPGSTLKPFIYGLALDQGLIHPNTVLKDVPHSFNGYNPENFDYDFMGPIKARDALVLSRNVPALYLSNQLANPSLHQLLEKAHVSQLRPESYYGLSLNLGGGELTMRELVGLYAMLANDGVWYPLNFLKKNYEQKGVRLLSAEASYLILNMLEDTPRSNSVADRSASKVAWKTGTSSGYRDAWTIGVFGPYVLGVWVGNFNNQANPAFIGKEIAAPLFFELVEAIQQEKGPTVATVKNPGLLNLLKIEVCKASGMLPTRHCLNRESTWFIPGKSPIKTDTIFREVAINPKSGLRTCHINENTRFAVYEFWPSDLLSIFRRAGIIRHTPPFFEPNCALTAVSGVSPEITSPQSGISYVVRTNSPQTSTIPFHAVTDAGIAYIYWFINETFIAKTRPGEPFIWQAKPGTFVVRVVDDRGLSDARDIRVVMDS